MRLWYLRTPPNDLYSRVVSIVCRNISILTSSSFSILCWSCIRIHFIPQKRVNSTWEEERWRTGAKFIENITSKLRELKRISWKQFEKDNNKFFQLIPRSKLITIRNLLNITSFIRCRVCEARTPATCLVPCQQTCFQSLLIMATKERRMKLVCPNVWNCLAKKKGKNTRYLHSANNQFSWPQARHWKCSESRRSTTLCRENRSNSIISLKDGF